MSKSVKTGLLVGVVGLVITGFASLVFGLCGPVLAIVAGVIAGIAGVERVVDTRGEAAKQGALAGVIAGVLVLVGQMIGGLVAVSVVQSTGAMADLMQQWDFGGEWAQLDPGAQRMSMLIGGIIAGTCFGLVDVVLSTLAGTVAGYFRAQPTADSMDLPPLE